MSGELVQLSNGIDPRQRRYSDQDKEATYSLWRLAAGRSCRRVSAMCGIAEQTVINWRNAGGWVERANAEDVEDIGSIRHGVAAVITHQLLASIDTAVEIRDTRTNDPKVRLAAAQWLAGIGGVAAVNKVEQAIVQEIRQTDAIDAEDLSKLSDDELMERELRYRGRKR